MTGVGLKRVKTFLPQRLKEEITRSLTQKAIEGCSDFPFQSNSFFQMRLGWASTPSWTATRCRRPTSRTARSPPPPASSTWSWASATPTSSPHPPPVNQRGWREWPSPTADRAHLSSSLSL